MLTGQKLQTLRTRAGMTQEQLAQTLFVSRELVSKWELGQRSPDIRMLRALAETFSVDVEDLADTDAFATELAQCVPEGASLTPEAFRAALAPFLDTLSPRDRSVFLRRYFYLEDVSGIAGAFGIRENFVRAVLARTRKKLKRYLKGAVT